MKRIHILGVLAAAALAGGGAAVDVALSGPGTPAAAAAVPASAAPAPGAPAATSAGLGTAALPPGTALVDGAGRTLYLFEADTGPTSTCTGACAQVWPPVLAPAAPGVAGGAQAALVGTSSRADGATQVTYAGHPLYYFAGDKAPGDTAGQGIHNFGGGWYVVTPSGTKIDDDDDAPAAKPAAAPVAPAPVAPAPAPVAPPAGTGYGY